MFVVVVGWWSLLLVRVWRCCASACGLAFVGVGVCVCRCWFCYWWLRVLLFVCGCCCWFVFGFVAGCVFVVGCLCVLCCLLLVGFDVVRLSLVVFVVVDALFLLLGCIFWLVFVFFVWSCLLLSVCVWCRRLV